MNFKQDVQTLILDTIPSIIILIDNDGMIFLWNRAACEIFALRAEQALGKRLAEIAVEWDINTLTNRINTVLKEGKPQRLEHLNYKRHDGKKGILGLTLTPVQGNDYNLLGCILQGAEITDRKRLESHLAHAQKMQSIGQLAAGIAHEINTPTQYIGDNICFLQEAFDAFCRLPEAYESLLRKGIGNSLPPELVIQLDALTKELDLEFLQEEIPQAIRQSKQGIEQVTRIVQAMKQFSYPDSLEKTAVNLNAAIENTVTVARNEWKYVADVELDLDPKLPLVDCLVGEFNQVILNMIVNAAHAIGEKLKNISEEKGKIIVSTRVVEHWAEVCIRDTGAGIPKAVHNRIFDPFFTTKEVGKGTGQGLAIAYSVIVEKHKGTITFKTAEGKGTTFFIRLPLDKQE